MAYLWRFHEFLSSSETRSHKVRPCCKTQAFFSIGLAELADCHSVSQPFIDLLVSSAEGKPSDRLNGFQIGNLMTDKVRFGQF
jgi:hypothetical protein